MMRELLEPLAGSEALTRLLAASGPRVGRADAAAHPYVLAALAEILEGPVMGLAPGPREAELLAAGAGAFLGPDRVALLPAWEALPLEGISPAPEIAARRHAAARRARSAKGPFVLVAPVVAALQRVVPDLGARDPISLQRGAALAPDLLADALSGAGYERAELVAHRGEFAVRGGIVDVFPGTSARPMRVEFWGDEVESVREFSPATQTSTRPIDRAEVEPVRELLPTEAIRGRAREEVRRHRGALRDALERLGEGMVFEGMERAAPFLHPRMEVVIDLLPGDAWVVVAGSRRSTDRAQGAADEAAALAEALGQDPALWIADPKELLEARERLDLSELADGVALGLHGWGAEAGRPQDVARRAAELAGEGYRVAATAAGRGSLDRMVEILAKEGVAAAPAMESGLLEGFVFPTARLAVLGEDDLFGRRRRAHDAPRVTGRTAASFAEELTPGDVAVHRVHGVGRYLGMVRREAAGAERDYLLLEYGAGDRLYVPADQVDAVTRYVGGDRPRIHRLGSSDWPKAQARVRRAVRDMAGELVRLYTTRMAATGRAAGPDTPWQRELEDAFPHTETPDQVTVIDEVKRDMESPGPMDRLICGDVGYGKTEIAVRAAFKAVMEGRQVAVLVPTTLLAEQHHVTFSERFAPFPVRVAMLSRFRSAAEQRDILRKLAAGEIDVIVGTHRLLSADVRFRDLGLLVVDEEQRFGVSHKERIKRLRVNVDVLTMTATPIPRTLEMALAGVRDLSVVDTPPEDRQPVLTHVGPYQEDVALGAVRRELRRGGQTFWVHNDVRTIDRRAGALAKAIPEARVAVVHGQMDEALLEKVMLGFWNGESDVLVCTTIIESGLDVPTANTLVIERADRLGLAQLYQLRGRVGRSAERAFAYLFFPPQARMTEEAHERLAAIGRHTALGSGFRIALRDLEIRGAGNLLGAEQHGHISAVGFDTYCRILAEQVSEMRGEPVEEEPDLRIELPVRAFLPVGYVGEERLRLDLYRRISSARSVDEVDGVEQEMGDRFGPIPPEASTLLELGRLRVVCRERGIAEVTTFRGQVRLRPVETEPDPLPPAAAWHAATRTLNLRPDEMGPGLPGWVRARVETAVLVAGG